jgi:peptidoglycan/LPS O-acetylase OafA/YrhL
MRKVVEASDKFRDNLVPVRLMLALAVIWSHAYPFSTGLYDPVLYKTGHEVGWWAVNAFIAISGYCILQSRQRSKSGGHFLWKRFLRVYPAYIACMVILLIAYPIRPAPVNWFNFFTFGPVRGGPVPELNVPVWTVRIEECVYLSVAALFAIKLAGRWMWVFLFAVVYGIYCTRINQVQPGDVGEIPDQFLRLVPYFCMGTILQQFKIPFKWFAVLLAAIALVAASLYGYSSYVAPFLLPYVILGIGLTKQVVKIPDVSYGVYLWGWPVMVMLAKGTKSFQDDPSRLFLVSAAICLAVAYISHLLIENPAQSLRDKLPRPSPKSDRAEALTDPETASL